MTVTSVLWPSQPAPSRTFLLLGRDCRQVVETQQHAAWLHQVASTGSPHTESTATVLAVISGLAHGCTLAVPDGNLGDFQDWPADPVDLELAPEFPIAANIASGGVSRNLEPSVNAEDLKWQQTDPAKRWVSRAQFVKATPGRLQILGGIDIRYDDLGCHSFRYRVAGMEYGEYSCRTYGAPVGIAFRDGTARWVHRPISK